MLQDNPKCQAKQRWKFSWLDISQEDLWRILKFRVHQRNPYDLGQWGTIDQEAKGQNQTTKMQKNELLLILDAWMMCQQLSNKGLMLQISGV